MKKIQPPQQLWSFEYLMRNVSVQKSHRGTIMFVCECFITGAAYMFYLCGTVID